MDSNFQYAGTGESCHSSFVVPDCLGRASLPPVRNRWFADSLLEEAGFELFVLPPAGSLQDAAKTLGHRQTVVPALRRIKVFFMRVDKLVPGGQSN